MNRVAPSPSKNVTAPAEVETKVTTDISTPERVMNVRNKAKEIVLTKFADIDVKEDNFCLESGIWES